MPLGRDDKKNMKFILGKKEEMTQIFRQDGNVVPVTVVKILPSEVVIVRTKDKDGYDSVQIGYGKVIEKKGKTGKNQKKFEGLKEFRFDNGDLSSFKQGDVIDAGVFSPGEKVVVSSVSKGKGFQGVVKRHGFSGGPRTHGQKHSEREPGSIGATGPQRVFKGTRMAGRMGGKRVTVKNLKIVHVDTKSGLLLLSGAVPGRRGTLIEIVG